MRSIRLVCVGLQHLFLNMHGEVKLVISCVFLSNQPDADASLYGKKVLEVSRTLTTIMGGKPLIEIFSNN